MEKKHLAQLEPSRAGPARARVRNRPRGDPVESAPPEDILEENFPERYRDGRGGSAGGAGQGIRDGMDVEDDVVAAFHEQARMTARALEEKDRVIEAKEKALERQNQIHCRPEAKVREHPCPDLQFLCLDDNHHSGSGPRDNAPMLAEKRKGWALAVVVLAIASTVERVRAARGYRLVASPRRAPPVRAQAPCRVCRGRGDRVVLEPHTVISGRPIEGRNGQFIERR